MSRPAPTCARCPRPVRPPGLWSSSWVCDEHGAVLPFHVAPHVSAATVAAVVAAARVPVWMPRPLPVGWTVTGLGHAGDERTGARATVVALSGPSPLGGPADLLLVAEEPGVGLGARLAGVPGPDPGPVEGSPEATLDAAGHLTALWPVPAADDRAAFVGEAKGLWLWAVLFPAAAALLLAEHVVLDDLRDAPALVDHALVVGAASTRLPAPAPAG